jgi:hypothetical protein
MAWRCLALLLALPALAGCRPEPLPGERTSRTAAARQDLRQDATQRGYSELPLGQVQQQEILVGDIERMEQLLSPLARVLFSRPERRPHLVELWLDTWLMADDARRQGWVGSEDEQLATLERLALAWLHEVSDAALVETLTEAERERRLTERWAGVERHVNQPAQRAGLVLAQARLEDLAQSLAWLREGVDAGANPYWVFHGLATQRWDAGPRPRQLDTGWVSPEDCDHGAFCPLVEALFTADALFEVSPPIQTARGWEVVMWTGSRDATSATAADARTWMEAFLVREAHGHAMRDALDGLRAAADIQRDDAAIARLDAQRAFDEPLRPRRLDRETLAESPSRLFGTGNHDWLERPAPPELREVLLVAGPAADPEQENPDAP